jgi:hypothetical protein
MIPLNIENGGTMTQPSPLSDMIEPPTPEQVDETIRIDIAPHAALTVPFDQEESDDASDTPEPEAAPEPEPEEEAEAQESASESTRNVSTLVSIEDQLKELQKAIQEHEAEKYFPGKQQVTATELEEWEAEIRRALALCRVISVRKNRISPMLDYQLRGNLTDAVYQLDFRRPFEVKVIGHTGAGKSTLLGAIFGEATDVFPTGNFDAVTAVRTCIRLIPQDRSQDELMSVHFLDPNRKVEEYKRAKWAEMSKKYVAEPVVDQSGRAEPNETHLVDYVEFTLCAKDNLDPLLPPDSRLVDLPGGAAGKASHEAIFKSELASADAIILVAGGSRLNSDLVRPIFKQVHDEVVNKKPDIASEMIFLVLTHWDEADSEDNIKKAVNAMKDLMRMLPANYEAKHRENPYYRMRALDAYFATMYILGKEKEPQVGSEEQKQDYLSQFMTATTIEKLRSLPHYEDLLAPKSLNKITIRHHQAMLELSNLHTLERDLQKFLAESRLSIRLTKARAELQSAIQSINALAWAEVRKYHPLIVEDIEELNQARQREQTERMGRYKDEIKYRVGNMKTAWEAAVEASLESLKQEASKNSFLKSLRSAHRRARKWVEKQIEDGAFSGQEFFPTNDLTIQNAHLLGTDIVRKKVLTSTLLATLRTRFWLALEHEMSRSNQQATSANPVEVLAQTFLGPLGAREQNKGPLNIDAVSEGEIGRGSEIQKRYIKIKQNVRRKAREACLSLTMSALLYHSNALDDQKHPSVKALDDYAQNDDGTMDEKKLVKDVLKEMVKNIIPDTQSIIIRQFHYELTKFLSYEVLTDDGQVVPHSGDFTELMDDISDQMRDLLREERTQRRFSVIFGKQDEEIAYWQDVLIEMEGINRGTFDAQEEAAA